VGVVFFGGGGFWGGGRTQNEGSASTDSKNEKELKRGPIEDVKSTNLVTGRFGALILLWGKLEGGKARGRGTRCSHREAKYLNSPDFFRG